MKFKILVTTFVALMMSFYGTQVLAGRDGKGNGGKDNTVNVCHVTGNSDGKTFLISVPEKALKGHKAHGDEVAIGGSCVGDEPSDAELVCLALGDDKAKWIPDDVAPDYGTCELLVLAPPF